MWRCGKLHPFITRNLPRPLPHPSAPSTPCIGHFVHAQPTFAASQRPGFDWLLRLVSWRVDLPAALELCDLCACCALRPRPPVSALMQIAPRAALSVARRASLHSTCKHFSLRTVFLCPWHSPPNLLPRSSAGCGSCFVEHFLSFLLSALFRDLSSFVTVLAPPILCLCLLSSGSLDGS